MKRRNWLWEIYFIFAAVNTLNQAASIFTPDAPVYNFYHILIAFDSWLGIHYAVRITCELLNITNLAALFLYVFNLTWLNKKTWQFLVAARIGFDIIGHYYEFVMLKSIYFARPGSAFQMLAWVILLTLPSYYACITYAFRKAR